MLNSIDSLSFSIGHHPGVYAILLGAGASKSTGTPTGWDITLDLVCQVAAMESGENPLDPERWWKENKGKQPDYSEVLSMLAPSGEARQNLLKSYFEPSEEEREEGLKQPTGAHRAIAKMVRAGLVQVILTTNFDRLMEQALQAESIQPTVISTPDAVEGASPLVRGEPTIVKLHGDYLDTRIKNSEDELAQYEEPVNGLLDQILDQYGLIVCGWSAQWDTALRKACKRRKNRRYQTYWAQKGELSDAAQRLIGHMDAKVVEIESADQLFEEVWEKASALREISSNHPLNGKVAVRRLERYLQQNRQIDLHNMVRDETERAIEGLMESGFHSKFTPGTPDDAKKIIDIYQSRIEVLLQLIIAGCYWGDQTYAYIWGDCVKRMANFMWAEDRAPQTHAFCRYPAMVLFYAGSIAAISSGRLHNLVELFNAPIIVPNSDSNRSIPGYLGLVHNRVIEQHGQRIFFNYIRRPQLTEHMYYFLRDVLRPFIPDDRDYEGAFAEFEMLQSLKKYTTTESSPGAPTTGRYLQKNGDLSIENYATAAGFADDIKKRKEDWPPYSAGLFGKMVMDDLVRLAGDWAVSVQALAEESEYLDL